MLIQVISIKSIEAGYQKGKFYSSPIYKRRATLLLENGEEIQFTFSGLKCSRVKRFYAGQRVTGAAYDPKIGLISASWDSNIL